MTFAPYVAWSKEMRPVIALRVKVPLQYEPRLGTQMTGPTLCQRVCNFHLLTHPGFVRLTRLSSFVDRDMFMRYYGGGFSHGNSAVAAEVTVDPAEVVHESTDTCYKFEDTNEKSNDVEGCVSRPTLSDRMDNVVDCERKE